MKTKKHQKRVAPMFQVEDQFFHYHDQKRANNYASQRNVTAKEVWVVMEADYYIGTVQRDDTFAEYIISTAEEADDMIEALSNGESLDALIRDRHHQYLISLEERARLLHWHADVVCVKFGEYLSIQKDLKVCMLSEKELWAVGYYNQKMNKIKMQQRVTQPNDILNEIEDEYRAYLLAKAQ